MNLKEVYEIFYPDKCKGNLSVCYYEADFINVHISC